MKGALLQLGLEIRNDGSAPIHDEQAMAAFSSIGPPFELPPATARHPLKTPQKLGTFHDTSFSDTFVRVAISSGNGGRMGEQRPAP
jgi:hypothetical protein